MLVGACLLVNCLSQVQIVWTTPLFKNQIFHIFLSALPDIRVNLTINGLVHAGSEGDT